MRHRQYSKQSFSHFIDWVNAMVCPTMYLYDKNKRDNVKERTMFKLRHIAVLSALLNQQNIKKREGQRLFVCTIINLSP